MGLPNNTKYLTFTFLAEDQHRNIPAFPQCLWSSIRTVQVVVHGEVYSVWSLLEAWGVCNSTLFNIIQPLKRVISDRFFLEVSLWCRNLWASIFHCYSSLQDRQPCTSGPFRIYKSGDVECETIHFLGATKFDQVAKLEIKAPILWPDGKKRSSCRIKIKKILLIALRCASKWSWFPTWAAWMCIPVDYKPY